MIHQYINNGYYIVLDVNSGSVHVVDDMMYDAIAIAESLIGELDAPRKLTEYEKQTIGEKLLEKKYPRRYFIRYTGTYRYRGTLHKRYLCRVYKRF